MATFKTFEEIDAWKRGRELTKRIYAVSGAGFRKGFQSKGSDSPGFSLDHIQYR